MAEQNVPATGPNGNQAFDVAVIRPILYQGKMVITTDLLARAYGAEAKHIQDNHANNRERFVEGVHFFKVTGDDLKVLKTDPISSGQFDKRAPALMLWTARGAARHAKILDTDEAWAMFEKLEDSYFAMKEGNSLTALPPGRVAPVFKDYFSICRLIGMDKNQAALGASRATRKLTGIDPLEMVGAQQLEAPQQAPHITATQVGLKVGALGGPALSAQAANKALEKHGFQFKDLNTDGGWNCTDKGHPHAVWVDTNRKHNDGAPVRQLRWSESVVGALIAEMSEVLSQPPANDDSQRSTANSNKRPDLDSGVR